MPDHVEFGLSSHVRILSSAMDAALGHAREYNGGWYFIVAAIR